MQCFSVYTIISCIHPLNCGVGRHTTEIDSFLYGIAQYSQRQPAVTIVVVAVAVSAFFWFGSCCTYVPPDE